MFSKYKMFNLTLFHYCQPFLYKSEDLFHPHLTSTALPSPSSNSNPQCTPIRCAVSFRYLGVVVQNNCTWSNHITATKWKCHGTLKLSKKLSHTSWGSTPTRVHNYIMLLKPLLKYGLECLVPLQEAISPLLILPRNLLFALSQMLSALPPIPNLHGLTSVPPMSRPSLQTAPILRPPRRQRLPSSPRKRYSTM